MDQKIMDQYEVNVFWSEEDGCFLAEIPALPGCIADGATEAEARQNALESGERWMEMARYMGREVPVPAVLKSEDLIAA